MSNKPYVIAKNPNGEQIVVQRGTYYCLLPKHGCPLPEDHNRWRGKELITKINYIGYKNVKAYEYDPNKPIRKSDSEDLVKADNSHLSDKMERFTYTPTTNYNILYIPVNRLRQVYQTDDAINPAKVRENMQKMREGIPLNPVEIGYDYDLLDGHHRWQAAIKLGYTHVPCKVVGTNAKKVREARRKYREVWKSETFYVDLGGDAYGTDHKRREP